VPQIDDDLFTIMETLMRMDAKLDVVIGLLENGDEEEEEEQPDA
jgi:hypothetical protein